MVTLANTTRSARLLAELYANGQITQTAVDVINALGQSQNKLDATVAPGVTNDNTEGYSVGSVWADVTADETYICTDVSTGAAKWFNTSLDSGDQIKVLYEGEDDTNAYTDADVVTVGLTSGTNTGDMSDAEVKTAYENNAETNAVTDAESVILGNTSGTNTGDMSDADVKTANENNADTNAFTDANVTTLGTAIQAAGGTMTGSFIVESFTVAGAPAATAGRIGFVSDETGGATLAYADGTNWKVVSTGVNISA